VWGRARDQGPEWLRRVHDRLAEVGFTAPILEELRNLVDELEQHWKSALHARTAEK